MVLQNSGNTISLSNIQFEFGGVNPINLSEYYNNGIGGYVVNITGIPTSGTITLSNFFSKAKPSVLPTIISNGVSANLTQIGTTGYYYYIFDSIINTNSITFGSIKTCNILIVGGGGGGGGGFGGAGGAGGCVNYISGYTFGVGTYNITIGSGGTGGLGYSGGVRNGQIGNPGNVSSITSNSITLYSANGGNGGDSSGRNFAAASGGGITTLKINNVITQQYSGGTGNVNGVGGYIGGGGAGAGQNGQNGLYTSISPKTAIVTYGNGGNGYSSTITTNGGTVTYYAGGGAGVVASGSDTPSAINGLGQNNSGGGGRGGWADNIQGGNGLKGCIIIAFTYP